MVERTAAISAGVFRAARAHEDRAPYDALAPDDLLSTAVADRTLATGWKRGNHPMLSLEAPVDWAGACGTDRPWAFHLHAWDGLGPVLSEYDRTGSRRYLDFAAGVAGDWIDSYPVLDDEDPFAWNDMATGLRAYRLAYLADALARSDDADDEAVERMLESLGVHRLALADDRRFASHSNHGLFQAAGQLAMARRVSDLPGMEEAAEQGAERLRTLVGEHFAEDGVHREHSPGYHHALLITLQRILDLGLLDDAELRAARARIEQSLAWLVLPDGSLAPFGDTDAEDRPAPAVAGSDPHLRFMLSRGADGSAPAHMVQGFPAGGYAICRRLDGADIAHSSYLAQICGFHSRTHKHADHLAVIWHERGHDLLVDAGRYDYLGRVAQGSTLARQGFWYSDPSRVYVESTRAHNTVEIDGRSHARRGVKPFGSALRRHGESDGIAYVETHVRHPNLALHTRVVLFEPGRWLLLLDTLAATRDTPHTYVQRLHFGPGLELEALQQAFGLRIPGEADRLYVLPLLPCTPIAPVKGQVEPRLAGWASRAERSMTPIWSAGYQAKGVATHTFATLLALTATKPIADREMTRANITARKARLAWRLGRERIQIDLDHEGPEFNVRRTTTPLRSS